MTDFDQEPQNDDRIETGIPQCPHCHALDESQPITYNAGAARQPHVSRRRWKCRNCGTIYDVTSAAGHVSGSQVIRPGRIP